MGNNKKLESVFTADDLGIWLVTCQTGMRYRVRIEQRKGEPHVHCHTVVLAPADTKAPNAPDVGAELAPVRLYARPIRHVAVEAAMDAVMLADADSRTLPETRALITGFSYGSLATLVGEDAPTVALIARG